MLSILSLLLPTISTVLGKLIPDAGKAAEINAELQKALIDQQGAIDKAVADAAKAQAEVNLEEAKSPSIFIAGWRPFIGWVCGFGCAYGFILQPFLAWFAAMGGVSTPPSLDMGTLMSLLGGLLGIGTMRTVEKIKGVDTPTLTQPTLRKK